MNAIFYFLMALALCLAVYWLIVKRNSKSKSIQRLEKDIALSLKVNKIQNEKVILSNQINEKLKDAQMVVDEKMLDLQNDLIEKVFEKE
ncbi:hypothetical protein [Flavobacterium sp.]|uniref:hypothetical protein n=1 Tax=Flavobacterium sp. TaxID=239 RepID=UPI002636E730|nr:hypothetical protein [Flavobacterium sp.]